MNLVNIKVRLVEKIGGWSVEVQKRNCLGFKYWVHIIPVSGIESESWYYADKETAIEEATKFFKWDLLYSVSKSQIKI
jgi:hypothetical protein